MPKGTRATVLDFWNNVKVEPDGCWLWQGYVANTGYGQLTVDQWHGSAHRLSYLLEVGPLSDGQEIHHTCNVRLCVNPGHLVAVTRKEHKQLSPSDITTQNALKEVCKYGHPFTPDNIRLYRGQRKCRECGRIRWRRWYQEQRVNMVRAGTTTARIVRVER